MTRHLFYPSLTYLVTGTIPGSTRGRLWVPWLFAVVLHICTSSLATCAVVGGMMWGPHDVTFDQTTRYEWVRVNGYYQVPLNPLPFICHLIPSGTAASIDRLFDGARPARRRLVALVDSFVAFSL